MKIYFAINNEIKDFYFVNLGKDNSVYFGSTASKFFKRGYTGIHKVTDNGSHIDFCKDGRPLTREEIIKKYSFHSSGILLTTGSEVGGRHRYQIKELSKYNEPIPLVGILPMLVTKYPETKNKIKKDDLIINLIGFIRPFAVLLYLKYPQQEDPMLIQSKEKWHETAVSYNTLGPYTLCTFIYTNKEKFTAWPSLEVNILAHPDQNTGKIPFPIFEGV